MDITNFLPPEKLVAFDAPSRPLPGRSGGVPPGPSTTAAEIRRIAWAPPGAPGGPAPVVEQNRYPAGIITLGGTVAASGSTQVVNDTPTRRIWMTVRNRSDSVGVLLLAIGQAANNATAIIELAIGGALLFDYAVPQDEIHIGASAAGAVNFTFSYCDMPS